MTQQINVDDLFTSNEAAIKWTFDPTPAERHVAQLESILGELDSRHGRSPRAKWARELLRPEIKSAKRYLAARAHAAANVEPFRAAFSAAIANEREATTACDAAYAAGDAPALMLARTDREIKGGKLNAARRAFADAIRTISDAKREASEIGGVVQAWQAQSDPSWGTLYLVRPEIRKVIDQWQIGYHNTAHDAATKQGAQYGIVEMIAAIAREGAYCHDPDCESTFAVRWERFVKQNGIVSEQAPEEPATSERAQGLIG